MTIVIMPNGTRITGHNIASYKGTISEGEETTGTLWIYGMSEGWWTCGVPVWALPHLLERLDVLLGSGHGGPFNVTAHLTKLEAAREKLAPLADR